ncbi:4-(cytidine 5'-diphospho)-2-C-methyl-D-erythritol kinase [Heliophilum fasciatum]|nr:4-(cytidine 5'-diphospho)-2-C-methyl-D-erythritol kinase [Heliophilum fasciatum]
MLAPAKINLSLDVLGRRDDGYHQVSMVMQTIALFDRVHVEEVSRSGVFLSGGSSEAPPDRSNLVYRAAALVLARAGRTGGVAIDLVKNIPVAAGLAGGSSDAAITIKLMNRLLGLGWSLAEMEALAAELGSDVPFLIRGGTALASGRGEQLTALPAAPTFWLVVVKPPFGASTPRVYQALGAPPYPGGQHREGATAKVMAALAAGSYGALIAAVGNDLEQVTIGWHQELQELKEALVRHGCDRALMSGSGPTILGFTEHEDVARQAAQAIEQSAYWSGYGVWVAKTLTEQEGNEG